MSILDEGFRAPGGTSRNRPHGNLRMLRYAVVGMFLLLGVRLAQMQIVDGAEYARRAEANHVVQKNILPTRGLILDRNGEPLVANVGVYSATVLPEALPSDSQFDDWKERRYKLYLKLQEITGTSSLEIQTRVEDAEEAGLGYIAIKVADNLTKQQALMLDEVAVEMPGVALTVTPGRDYNAGEEFSHLLGYIGPQFAEDAARLDGLNYEFNEPIGKDGLEARYEADLRGVVGHSAVEQDAYGRLITALQTKDPVPGNSLQLALDAGLQRFTAELLADSLPSTLEYGTSQEAAAVVMNPHTGEIYAMVSIPTYDNNIWAESKIRGAELDALAKDNRTYTLLNKALSGWAPGSTFKLITAAAGLEEGSITPNTSHYVGSELLTEGENGVEYSLPDWRAHNMYMNIQTAIAWSSNVFMALTAGGDKNNRGLGEDVDASGAILATWARRFGLAAPTGIDLYGEGAGRIPDPQWKERTKVGEGFAPGENDWFIGDTYNTSIGQGDVLATPLQIARMTAAFANGGKLVTPHLVNQVISPSGEVVRTIEPELKDIGVSQTTIDTVRGGMLGSVQYGAGSLAQIPHASVAGKTGTAEYYDAQDKVWTQHAWFTGFAPYNDPEVVVTVYFEKGIGGTHAAPVAAKILEYYFENMRP